MTSESSVNGDLSAYGILPPQEVQKVFLQTVHDVISPGLARFGIEALGI